MNRLILKQGREKPLLRHHPWIFSGIPGSSPELSHPLKEIRSQVKPLQFLTKMATSWPGGHTAPTHRFEHASGVGMKAIRLTANS